MSLIVRPQLIGDTDTVRELLSEAFTDDGRAATLAEALLDGPSRIALVAEYDGETAGHVQLSHAWLDAERQLVDVLVLSPLGVAPRHQRSGVGKALVRAALDGARHRGDPLVFLEGQPDYYPQFGFRRGAELGFTAPSARIPAVAFQVMTLPSWEPWMTGGLIYPDTFWAYDCVGRRRRAD